MGPSVDQMLDQAASSNCEGRCYTGMDSTSEYPQVFKEGQTPWAQTMIDQPGVQYQVNSGASFEPITRSFHKELSFGNSTIGAGYVVDANLTAIPAMSGAPANLNASAEMRAFITFFSDTDLVRSRLVARFRQNDPAQVEISTFFLGQEVGKQVIAQTTIVDTLMPDEKMLMNRLTNGPPQGTVGLFGIEVELREVTGTVFGHSLKGRVTTAGFRLNYIPQAKAVSLASAQVRVLVFFGPFVRVANVTLLDTLNFIDINAPITLNATAGSCESLDFTLRSNLSVAALSGSLQLFVRILLFNLFPDTFSFPIFGNILITLASTPGFSENAMLANEEARVGFPFLCTPELMQVLIPPAPTPPPAPAPPPPAPPPPTRPGGPRTPTHQLE
jgi:hypothetical protein